MVKSSSSSPSALATLELANPVLFFVLVEADDFSVHSSKPIQRGPGKAVRRPESIPQC